MKKKVKMCRYCSGHAGKNGMCRECTEKIKLIRSIGVWKTEHQKLLDEISGNTKESEAEC